MASRVARAGIVLAVVLLQVPCAMAVLPDSWSALVRWKVLVNGQEWTVHPWHATLTREGDVLLIGYRRPVSGSAADVYGVYRMTVGTCGPGNCTTFVQEISPPTLDGGRLACAGHTFTADGKLFLAGGITPGSTPSCGGTLPAGCSSGYCGRGTSQLLDSRTTTWSSPRSLPGIGQGGTNLRWYPTATRLYDKKILVSHGQEHIHLVPCNANRSVDVYDPATSSSTTLSFDPTQGGQPATPSVAFVYRDYPHLFQLPSPEGPVDDHDVLYLGDDSTPLFLSRSPTFPNPVWAVPPSANRRPRASANACAGYMGSGCGLFGASSTLLPLRLVPGQWGYAPGSVLVAGGETDVSRPNGALGNTVDRFDPSLSAWGTWLPPLTMRSRRYHGAAVLLPSGDVLVVNGHNHDCDPASWSAACDQLMTAEYVHLRPTHAVEPGTNPSGRDGPRGYHSVALLLPDGRVLVGSGNPAGGPLNERNDFRYYSPSYLIGTAASRPIIASAPASIGYGCDFTVNVDPATGRCVDEVVLMGLGAMTHSLDMNQRYVQLAFGGYTCGGSSLRITPPSDDTAGRRKAPPGPYMLFLMNGGVPSVATIVTLGAACF